MPFQIDKEIARKRVKSHLLADFVVKDVYLWAFFYFFIGRTIDKLANI